MATSLNSNKRRQYARLVAERKTCRLCAGLTNPSCAKLRKLDSDEVGPWTLLFGELDADVLVVGQDWGDVSYFQRNKGRDDPRTPTNRNLLQIMQKSELIGPSKNPCGPTVKMFWTNAILCLKEGGLQAKVKQEWFNNCGVSFLRRQIEIVRPRAVVGLGAKAFQSCLDAFSKERISLSEAINDRDGIELVAGVRLFAAYHCGARTLAINRSLDQQVGDWKRITKFIDRAN